VAVLGAGGGHKTEASIVRAARALGHASRLVNVVGWSRYAGPLAGRGVRLATDAFAPDFVLLTRHAILLGEPTLRALLRGRARAFWYFDLQPKPAVLALARLAERMYVSSLSEVETFRAAGIPSVQFLPQGVDPDRDVPAASCPPGDECDVSFVGSGQYPHRYAVLRAVAAAGRLQIRGPSWEDAPRDLPVTGGAVHGRRLAEVIRGAAISLGANAHPEQDGARASASNRMWKVLGCSGFYLGQRVPDIERFAAGGRHCAWYDSPGEAAAQVRHYLARPEERVAIAAAGRAHALKHHTYARRLELLLAGRAYELDRPGSDERVVPELEHPDAGQPLDRP
ncbi:MAG TPA: glycosyltransferase, partial [Gemmatimonadales bacterium]|nr:glycosyltransferase [Gemmatimonadales bacterium]